MLGRVDGHMGGPKAHRGGLKAHQTLLVGLEFEGHVAPSNSSVINVNRKLTFEIMVKVNLLSNLLHSFNYLT